MSLPQTLAAWHAQTPALSQLNALGDMMGASLWLVGGAVRAALAGAPIPPDDIDICVAGASARDLARALADTQGGHYVPLDPAFGIHRAVIHHTSYDLAEARNHDIASDLARRDLTLNAMALSLTGDVFLDPYGGQADAAARVIRMVQACNFDDDPLRLLRAFRFQAHLSPANGPAATLEPATRTAIATRAERLRQPAGERIHVEMLKLLGAPACFAAVEAMADTGILEILLPELIPTRQIPPNSHHHLGLFEHTLELVRQCERLLPTLGEHEQAHCQQALTPFATRAAMIKLACLLHDVGKPQTWVIQPHGRHTFYGHDQVSETMCQGVARRWKLSRDLGERLQRLTRWHLYPCQFGPASSRKSVLKFLRRMGDSAVDVTLLALADRHSTLGPAITAQDLAEADAHHRWLMAQAFVEADTLRQPPLLDGQAVMQLLGWPPGPRVGQALAALREAQQLGTVNHAEEARVWLCQMFGASAGPGATASAGCKPPQ